MTNFFFRFRNYLTYRLERFLIRGTHYRLFAIACLLLSISFIAGLTMLVFSKDFSSAGEAIWWAFLRLTDPGYLGDDEGYLRRTVSVVVTVLGYVFFMGSLVAIMTQWLNTTLEVLERGETPILRDNHLLILGWTERVPVIAREILLSEGRVKRFLSLFGESKLEIVILADGDSLTYQSELKTALGPLWNERKITIRSGSPLRLAHLDRVAFTGASVVIIPGSDFRDTEELDPDTAAIKTLLTANQALKQNADRSPPRVVVELENAENVPTAKRAYSGEVQAIVGVDFISRLFTQNIRHPGLSYIYSCLLSHSDGTALYVKGVPEAVGKTVGDTAQALKEAVLLGIVESEGNSSLPRICPPRDMVIKPKDQLLAFARSYEALSKLTFQSKPALEVVPQEQDEGGQDKRNKILVLGWSDKASALALELSAYSEDPYHVTFVSSLPVEKRSIREDRRVEDNSVFIEHIVADFGSKSSFSKLHVENYSSILILGSNWLSSKEDSDARTLLGYLHLSEALEEIPQNAPRVIIELLSSSNASLVDSSVAEIIPSGLLLSHLIAQVSLRPELLEVFEHLFGFGGAEIQLKPLSTYLSQKSGRTTLHALFPVAVQRNEIVLGALQRNNPSALILSLHEEFQISGDTEVAVITSGKT